MRLKCHVAVGFRLAKPVSSSLRRHATAQPQYYWPTDINTEALRMLGERNRAEKNLGVDEVYFFPSSDCRILFAFILKDIGAMMSLG